MSKVIGVVTDKGLLNVTNNNGVLEIDGNIIPQKKLLWSGLANGGIASSNLIVANREFGDIIQSNKCYEVRGKVLGNAFRMRFTTVDDKVIGDSELRHVMLYATDTYPRDFCVRVIGAGVEMRFGIYMFGGGVEADSNNSNNTIIIENIYEIIE